MPTIGVNLLWLVPGVVGGSEEYTLRLLRALDADADTGGLGLRIYGQPGLVEAHPDLRERFEVRLAPAISSKSGRIVVENSWLAWASRRDDLVHHAGGVIPLIRRAPAVVTIHDLQPLEMPAHFSAAKRRWLAHMIPRSARAARMVLAPSEFTAERVSTLIGVDASRIRVVPHGLEPQEPGVLDRAADERLRRRFGRYVLLPAIAYPHKRHADLILALDRLRVRFDDLAVVFTGRAGPETPALKQLAIDLALERRVHQLGRVPIEELDALYRSATAVVFPSAYEGFGNPVLEAMARGAPVITSDAGALPSVAGSAAITIAVGDIGALADAIGRVIEDQSLRASLVAAGPAQAARFTSEAAAATLLDCYRQSLAVAS